MVTLKKEKNERRYDFYNYNSIRKNGFCLHFGIDIDFNLEGHKSWSINICGFAIESYLEKEEAIK